MTSPASSSELQKHKEWAVVCIQWVSGTSVLASPRGSVCFKDFHIVFHLEIYSCLELWPLECCYHMQGSFAWNQQSHEQTEIGKGKECAYGYYLRDREQICLILHFSILDLQLKVIQFIEEHFQKAQMKLQMWRLQKLGRELVCHALPLCSWTPWAWLLWCS